MNEKLQKNKRLECLQSTIRLCSILIFILFLTSFISAVEIVEAHGKSLTETGSISTKFGEKIVVGSTAISIYSIKKASVCTATTGYLTDSACNILANSSFIDDVAIFSSPITLSIGETYYVFADSGGSAYTYALLSASGYPVAGTYLSWTASNNGAVCPTNDATNQWANIISVNVSIGTTPILETTLTSPINYYNITLPSINFSSTYNYTNLDITNATYYLWKSDNSIFNKTKVSVSSSLNSSSLIINNLVADNYKWNVYACGTNSTATICSWATSNYTLNISSFTINSETHNSTTYESMKETFILNVTSINSSLLTSVNLIYDTTFYPMLNEGAGIWSYSFNPILVKNNTIIYQLTYNGINYNSTNYSQVVDVISFGLCNSSLNISYLNISFADEANGSLIQATISSIAFNYWINNITFAKYYSYSSSNLNSSYSFCFSPFSKSITTNYTISYANPNYATRTYIQGQIPLTNITTNKTLYLLLTSSGQLVTFQIVNPAQQPITGVVGTAARIISGTSTIIGSGVSGSDGGISFFVNPLLSYTFTFSATGYTSYTLTTTPSQGSYTVTLGLSSQGQQDYTRGVSQTILPPRDILTNNTVYNFNYTINSSYWGLDSFGFYLYGNSTYLITSVSSSSSTGGIVSVNANTTNYSLITMNYYYVINGTTINSSTSWYVSNVGEGRFSILNFFTDLKNYIVSGWFGMTQFTVGIIIFFVIFISVGMVSYKFGFTSHAAVISILAGIVIFFDAGLGFDNYLNPLAASGAVPYLPSVLMLLIALATILRESTR